MVIRFRQVDKDIYEAIKDGRKDVETRAATTKYRNVKAGDRIIFVCGQEKISKQITKVHHFSSAAAMAREIASERVLPNATQAELESRYRSFPGYTEKIAKHGLFAWELA